MFREPIYLDYNATSPLDPRVLEAMLPYFSDHFGNPSIGGYVYSWEAEAAVKKARQTVAQTIKCSPEEIIFTSGATESNNLAIKGVVEANLTKGNHLITAATEHSSVLETFYYLKKLGFELTILPVDPQGLIDPEQLKKSLKPETILVSIMVANNEIGVLQPIGLIGEICHHHQILFHTDAAQAIGKIDLDVERLNIDLMSMTAHKICGPKGIGALYVRRKNPRVNLLPQLHGGGQERGLRSGTLATPQIVGLSKALELANLEIDLETERLKELREQLWQYLSREIEGIHLNGHAQLRLANNLNVSIEGLEPNRLLRELQSKIAISSGSACSWSTSKPSHVLRALGRSDQLAQASLRFGLGRFTTEPEIERVKILIAETVYSLRRWRDKSPD